MINPIAFSIVLYHNPTVTFTNTKHYNFDSSVEQQKVKESLLAAKFSGNVEALTNECIVRLAGTDVSLNIWYSYPVFAKFSVSTEALPNFSLSSGGNYKVKITYDLEFFRDNSSFATVDPMLSNQLVSVAESSRIRLLNQKTKGAFSLREGQYLGSFQMTLPRINFKGRGSERIKIYNIRFATYVD